MYFTKAEEIPMTNDRQAGDSKTATKEENEAEARKAYYSAYWTERESSRALFRSWGKDDALPKVRRKDDLVEQ